MCEAYIAAGLPPERFWQITPRLYLIEMRGASRRAAQLRGLAWDNALMARDGVKPPARDAYAAMPAPIAARRRDWRADEAAWRGYVAGTAARARKGGQ